MICPVCTDPIEPKTVVACKRCFALFPRKDQQRLRQIYVAHRLAGRTLGADYHGMLDRLARQTRERHPETRPANIRDKSPLGPSPGIASTGEVAQITIQ